MPSVARPRLAPLRGDRSSLPPALVVIREFDPLRDEGDAYAAALAGMLRMGHPAAV